MTVVWNPYIPQRGAKFAIRESTFSRGRQVAPVEAAPGSLDSQRVSIAEFNRLLDGGPRPVYPLALAPLPYPPPFARPVMPVAPVFVPSWPSPVGPVLAAPVPAVESVPRSVVAVVAPSGALPPQSDFLSGVRFSAWWQYLEGQIAQVCATQGAAFIRALRSALGLAAGDTWDAAVQMALIARVMPLAGDPAWASTLLQLRNDLTAQSISGLSLKTGIYAAYYAASGRRFDAIVVPSNTIMPLWGQPPAPDSGRDGLVCFDPNTESADAPRGGIDAAMRASTTGIRVGEGYDRPGLGTVVDPVSGAIGMWGFLAAAAGIGAVAWAVTPKDRSNPGPTLIHQRSFMSRSDETREFARRRSLPHVEAKVMSGKRYTTVVLIRRGEEIGERLDVITRGKVTSTTYFLPPLADESRGSR